ncbi:hypothetical protein V3G68_25610, partial [Escherichia coli]|uniref:hypothetical protein n=1 Tax=Escherichia coli TaxID=562 RepID=UPI0035938574
VGLLSIVRRVDALEEFLTTQDGANLLAGAKRASNILRIEERKDGKLYDDDPDEALYVVPEERALAESIERARTDANAAMAKDDYA